MKRYTFAICVSCGVQSPPLILDDGSTELAIPLSSMGWRFDKMRFTAQAICPDCLKFKKDNEKKTVSA